MGKLGIRILVPLKQMERKEEGAIKKAQSYAPSTHILSLSRETIYSRGTTLLALQGVLLHTHARTRTSHASTSRH